MDGEVDQQKWKLIIHVVWKTINTCKECKETSAETSREPEKKTHESSFMLCLKYVIF
jgi:hypothetical protein